MKKLFHFVLLLLLFAGCARSQGDQNVITVWHWMTDRNDTFKELAKRYEQQTGVKVKINLFAPSDLYKKKIIASTQAKILPDIFGILDTKKTFSDFIKYGYVADLTEEFEKDEAAWKNRILEKALSSNVFEENNGYEIKPGIYGVPIDMITIQMIYNRKLLSKAGWKNPPTTFDEFVKVSHDLKKVGISTMVSGWGEEWMVGCFASNYAFNIMGEDKIMATYRGEVPYTDPDWIEVFTLFQKLAENEMLMQGVVAKPNKEAEQDFALERAAFAFNGSWSVNVYREMNPNLDYEVMMPPKMMTKYPIKIWGGAGSSFVVNGRSPRKAQAIAFLKWLTDTEQQEYLTLQTNNLPSNKKALASIPQTLKGFERNMDTATHPTIWEFNEQALVTQSFGKGLQSILLGKKTPKQVALEVQEVKEREMKKATRRR